MGIHSYRSLNSECKGTVIHILGTIIQKLEVINLFTCLSIDSKMGKIIVFNDRRDIYINFFSLVLRNPNINIDFVNEFCSISFSDKLIPK